MHAELLSPTPENVARAAERLRAGEVVGMPTETVYGLAGNAFDPRAVARIFAVKERPTFDPLIVHVALEGGEALEGLAALGLVEGESLGAKARARLDRLTRAFWPGPLTLVLPRGGRVPDLVTSGLPSVAVRFPAHPVAQALIRAAGTPLAAPSANRFGRISPTSAADVAAELGARIPLILDGGRCSLGVESTVLAIDPEGSLSLLRPGGVGRDALEALLGVAVEARSVSAAEGDSVAGPGMLASHYAPRKPLHLLEGSLPSALPEVVGYLAQSGNRDAIRARLEASTGRRVIVHVLSASGDLEEAARNLFAQLRALDASEATLLFAEPCLDERGLGHAIGDRLRRASFR